MSPCATYDDVNLILKLYDLRREERMRQARTWFGAHCRFGSFAEFEEACPEGSEGYASFWQVLSYWDMAASFITAGVLHKELFFESGGEMLFVWSRAKRLLGGLRERCLDPRMFHNLEAAATEYEVWWAKRAPGAYEAMEADCKN